MNENQDYKFRRIEYWPDDDRQGILFCIQYATKDLEDFAVFAFPISRDNFSNLEFRRQLENKYSNLEIVDCIKKLLTKHPKTTEDILNQIPQNIFANSEKMMEVFETISNNAEQIEIAKHVINNRKKSRKNKSNRNNYIDMLSEYNSHTF